MKSLVNYLTEAKTGRGWNGKLKNLDNLFSWMYDKGILNKGEQNKKDKIFTQYYRYYNDGDIPRGFTHTSGKVIEDKIEEDLETFMKKILSKYLPKIDRREFRYDQVISDLSYIMTAIEQEDFNQIKFWVSQAKVSDPEFNKVTNEFEKIFNKLKSLVEKHYPNYARYVLSYSLREIKNDKENMTVYKKFFEKDIMKLESLASKLKDIVSNLIEAVEKLKKELGK